MKYGVDNRKFWDRVSGSYDFVRKADKKAYDVIIGNIKEEISKNSMVLEVAAGTGYISLHIADSCGKIIATDFSNEMIKVANRKQKPENLSFSVQDATNLPYADKTFDVVIIAHALHIMPNPKKALLNIKRVLKDGGVLIAPNFIKRGNFLDAVVETPMKILGFRTYSKWKYDEYLEFLKENGLELIKHNIIKSKIPIAYVVVKKT